MSKIVVFIYLLIIWILRAIKGIFIEALESFQIDMVLLDTMVSEKKFKLSIVLSFFATVPLLLVSVFVAGTGLGSLGNLFGVLHEAIAVPSKDWYLFWY